MGYIMLSEQKWKEAKPCFEKVLGSTKNLTLLLSAHLGIAVVYNHLKDQVSANEHYSKAIEIEPNLFSSLVNIQKEMIWYELVRGVDALNKRKVKLSSRKVRIQKELKRLEKPREAND